MGTARKRQPTPAEAFIARLGGKEALNTAFERAIRPGLAAFAPSTPDPTVTGFSPEETQGFRLTNANLLADALRTISFGSLPEPVDLNAPPPEQVTDPGQLSEIERFEQIFQVRGLGEGEQGPVSPFLPPPDQPQGPAAALGGPGGNFRQIGTIPGQRENFEASLASLRGQQAMLASREFPEPTDFSNVRRLLEESKIEAPAPRGLKDMILSALVGAGTGALSQAGRRGRFGQIDAGSVAGGAATGALQGVLGVREANRADALRFEEQDRRAKQFEASLLTRIGSIEGQESRLLEAQKFRSSMAQAQIGHQILKAQQVRFQVSGNSVVAMNPEGVIFAGTIDEELAKATRLYKLQQSRALQAPGGTATVAGQTVNVLKGDVDAHLMVQMATAMDSADLLATTQGADEISIAEIMRLQAPEGVIPTDPDDREALRQTAIKALAVQQTTDPKGFADRRIKGIFGVLYGARRAGTLTSEDIIEGPLRLIDKDIHELTQFGETLSQEDIVRSFPVQGTGR